MIELNIYFDIVKKAQDLEALEQKVNKLDDATLKEPLETMIFILKARVAQSIERKNAEIMKIPLVRVPSREVNDTSAVRKPLAPPLDKNFDEDVPF
jgi:hypothetical protein